MPRKPTIPAQTLLPVVLDEVGVAMVVIDSDARFVFTNRAARKMLGSAGIMNRLSFEKWGRKCVFRDSLGRPMPPEQAPIMRALAGKRVPPQHMEVTPPNGRRKWLHAAGHHFSALGLKGVLVIVTDETEQVELRLALQRAQHAAALGLLAGGIVHDLNNMLSVISGNIGLLQADGDVPERAQARLQQMTAAVKRGTALAKRLARYRRTQEPHLCTVQINDLVNVALELVCPLVKEGVNVRTELGLVPLVEVDPSRIEQVLVNLILNALDAMPEGGEITLRTSVAEAGAVAEINSAEDAGTQAISFVCVTVADTGIGIPKRLQRKIFDSFFTTKPSGKGSGLGLASAYDIVRQHKGFIDVQSSTGAGTKFNIYLPAQKDSSANRRQQTAA